MLVQRLKWDNHPEEQGIYCVSFRLRGRLIEVLNLNLSKAVNDAINYYFTGAYEHGDTQVNAA